MKLIRTNPELAGGRTTMVAARFEAVMVEHDPHAYCASVGFQVSSIVDQSPGKRSTVVIEGVDEAQHRSVAATVHDLCPTTTHRTIHVVPQRVIEGAPEPTKKLSVIFKVFKNNA
jgi:hypothetical protein